MKWKNIIQSLIDSGLTQVQIAQKVGVAQPTIAALLSGSQKDMRWVNGDKLLALHKSRVGRSLKPRAPLIQQDEPALPR